MNRRTNSLWIVLGTAVLLAAACSPAREPADGPENGASRTLRIGVLQFLPTLNIFVAEQAGFFEAEGLDVELVLLRDQALVGTAVESGDIDIGSRNYDGIFAAVAQGLEQQALYPHVLYSSDEPDAQMMIRTDLWDEDPQVAAKGLEGQPFALDIGGQTGMATRVHLENQFGVDVDSMEFIDVPFSDQLAAFEQRSIAGGVLVEPFAQLIEATGAARFLGYHLDSVALLPPYGNGTREFLIQVSFAQTQWIADNEDTVDRFVRAMTAATEAILEDPGQFDELAIEWTGLDREIVLDGLYPEKYVVKTSISRDEAEAPIRFNIETGLVQGPLELDDVLADQFPLEE